MCLGFQFPGYIQIFGWILMYYTQFCYLFEHSVFEQILYASEIVQNSLNSILHNAIKFGKHS